MIWYIGWQSLQVMLVTYVMQWLTITHGIWKFKDDYSVSYALVWPVQPWPYHIFEPVTTIIMNNYWLKPLALLCWYQCERVLLQMQKQWRWSNPVSMSNVHVSFCYSSQGMCIYHMIPLARVLQWNNCSMLRGSAIGLITYVTGIGNGSRELILIIHALANNHCWKCFLNKSNRKTSFSQRIRLQEYW